MIAFVRGPVTEVGLTHAVVEVGGIGLLLQCAPQTLSGLRLGQESRIATSLVVREDSLTLFGFSDDEEKQLFELLQTASGVGPKLAQAMLAVLPPDRIRTAIASDDAKTLTAVPGVGPKSAQRIILELKDRIGVVPGTVATPVAAAQAWQAPVHAGLVGLGWSAKEADAAIVRITPDAEAMAEPQVGELLRLALRTLSKA